MKEEQEKKEETVEEVTAKLETATKKLEEASAKLAKDRADFEVQKAEKQLAGQSEAGRPPVEKTWQEKVDEDIQSVIPDEFLPRSLKKKK